MKITASVAALSLLLMGCAGTAMPTTGAEASHSAATAKTGEITEGQKVIMATHSFNVIIAQPLRTVRQPDYPDKEGVLGKLATEAGFEGHEFLEVQFIGGSTPMQHWNQGGSDEKNLAKKALREHTGEVDVFTMSPNAIIPEEGIDLFGDLVIETNPQARILVQNNWSGWDGNGSTPAVGGTGAGSFGNEDRDDTTLEMIEGWLTSLEAEDGYLPRLRAQLEGIDERAGHEMTYIVPSANAVYTARKAVLAGALPGVERQSQMFVDAIGHAAPATVHLVNYVWFATMYGKSPVGLQSYVQDDDPTAAAREELLQKIAWNAVVAEPKSGVTGEAYDLGF